METAQTKDTKTPDGVHIDYRVRGEGRLDLVSIESKGVLDRWRPCRVVDV